MRPAANARWAEAEALLRAGHQWGAHCLVGLSVEQALKAWCVLNWFPKGSLSPDKDAREAFRDMFLGVQAHRIYLDLSRIGWDIKLERGKWLIKAPSDSIYTQSESFHSILFWAKLAELVSLIKFSKAINTTRLVGPIVSDYSNEDRYRNNPSGWRAICYRKGLELHIQLDLDKI
jgi:hypothetical protein